MFLKSFIVALGGATSIYFAYNVADYQNLTSTAMINGTTIPTNMLPSLANVSDSLVKGRRNAKTLIKNVGSYGNPFRRDVSGEPFTFHLGADENKTFVELEFPSDMHRSERELLFTNWSHATTKLITSRAMNAICNEVTGEGEHCTGEDEYTVDSWADFQKLVSGLVDCSQTTDKSMLVFPAYHLFDKDQTRKWLHKARIAKEFDHFSALDNATNCSRVQYFKGASNVPSNDSTGALGSQLDLYISEQVNGTVEGWRQISCNSLLQYQVLTPTSMVIFISPNRDYVQPWLPLSVQVFVAKAMEPQWIRITKAIALLMLSLVDLYLTRLFFTCNGSRLLAIRRRLQKRLDSRIEGNTFIHALYGLFLDIWDGLHYWHAAPDTFEIPGSREHVKLDENDNVDSLDATANSNVDKDLKEDQSKQKFRHYNVTVTLFILAKPMISLLRLFTFEQRPADVRASYRECKGFFGALIEASHHKLQAQRNWMFYRLPSFVQRTITRLHALDLATKLRRSSATINTPMVPLYALTALACWFYRSFNGYFPDYIGRVGEVVAAFAYASVPFSYIVLEDTTFPRGILRVAAETLAMGCSFALYLRVIFPELSIMAVPDALALWAFLVTLTGPVFRFSLKAAGSTVSIISSVLATTPLHALGFWAMQVLEKETPRCMGLLNFIFTTVFFIFVIPAAIHVPFQIHDEKVIDELERAAEEKARLEERIKAINTPLDLDAEDFDAETAHDMDMGHSRSCGSSFADALGVVNESSEGEDEEIDFSEAASSEVDVVERTESETWFDENMEGEYEEAGEIFYHW